MHFHIIHAYLFKHQTNACLNDELKMITQGPVHAVDKLVTKTPSEDSSA